MRFLVFKIKMVKTMLDKIEEDYERTIKNGNGGHAIGFYVETGDNTAILEGYEFPQGVYTQRYTDGNFFCWDYDIKQ